eukprot:tig00000743_g3883.t1
MALNGRLLARMALRSSGPLGGRAAAVSVVRQLAGSSHAQSIPLGSGSPAAARLELKLRACSISLIHTTAPRPHAYAPLAPVWRRSFAAAAAGKLTLEEVAKHNSPTDLWLVIHGKVYDVTGFVKDHPGGEAITVNAGGESTEDFEAIHKPETKASLADWYIGDVDGDFVPNSRCVSPPSWIRAAGAAPAAAAAAAAEASGGPPVTLDPRHKVAVRLLERENLTRNTRRLRFGLPSGEHVLGLPVGQHVLLSAEVAGRHVMRAYTPVTADEVRGYFDLVVKVYFANEHPKFPEGGAFTQHLEGLPLGGTVDVLGPFGSIIYRGRGEFDVKGVRRRARRVGMIAGGSGITPVYQVVRAMLADPSDPTEVSVLFANQSVEEVLLRAELESLAHAHPARLRLHLTVDRAPAPPAFSVSPYCGARPAESRAWPYSVGFVTEDMIREHLPGPAEEALVFMCGPPPMLQGACIPALQRRGFRADQYFCF